MLTGEVDLLFNDYDEVKKFLNCPIRDIHKYAEIRKEFTKMHQHLDRHLNEIMFVKCEDLSCCKQWQSKDILQYFGGVQSNIKFPSPTLSKERKGHYNTFLQECLNESKRYGHDGQPSAAKENLGACPSGCKSYHFKSKTGKARHISVFHRRQSVAVETQQSAIKCNVNGCGKVFSSLSTLNRHKSQVGHTARRMKPRIDQEPSARQSVANYSLATKRKGKSTGKVSRKRQRALQELLRNANERNCDEREDPCGAIECIIARDKSDNLEWVQCDQYEAWIHTFCGRLENISSNEMFICECCL